MQPTGGERGREKAWGCLCLAPAALGTCPGRKIILSFSFLADLAAGGIVGRLRGVIAPGPRDALLRLFATQRAN